MNIRIFLFLFFIQFFLLNNSHAEFRIGYGKMDVGKIFVADKQDSSLLPSAFSDRKWDTLTFGIGSNISSSNIGVSLDFLFSEKRKLEDLGSRSLIGGGTTRVSSSISHVGLFFGVKYRLIRAFFLEAGYGAVAQEVGYDYSSNVSNGGGGGNSIEFNSSYISFDLELVKGLRLGIRRYKIHPLIKLTSFNITFQM